MGVRFVKKCPICDFCMNTEITSMWDYSIWRLIKSVGCLLKFICIFLGEQLRLTVTVDDYLDKLVEYGIMKLYAIASVEETRQTWADEDDFQVLKPSIDVKVEYSLKYLLLNTLTGWPCSHHSSCANLFYKRIGNSHRISINIDASFKLWYF